jgi:uncharacterized protein YcgL (UPF0745 family)
MRIFSFKPSPTGSVVVNSASTLATSTEECATVKDSIHNQGFAISVLPREYQHRLQKGEKLSLDEIVAIEQDIHD